MKELRRTIARYLGGGLGPYLLHGIICLLYATLRVEARGAEIMASFVRRGEGFTGVFWHGRLLLLPFLYPGRQMHVLISVHRDGEMIARVMERFGFGLVRGSSGRGGVAALKEMVRLLGENKDVAITPDGPRGPREELKPGTAQVAMISRKALLPVAFGASRAWQMKSWDRFLIPKPFSRVVFVVGEPVRHEDGEDQEQFCQRIEAALRRVTEEADRAAGGKAPED